MCIMAYVMVASLHDPLPTASDESKALALREASVKTESVKGSIWAHRASHRLFGAWMNAYEENITGNSASHWLTCVSPAVPSTVWPGDISNWLTAEGVARYPYLWDSRQAVLPARIEGVARSNIVAGVELPDVPVW